MKRAVNILTLISILMVLGAPSCVDEQGAEILEAELLERSQEEIREEFETDYLDEESLFAYEVTAMQKLTDFTDYLQLMTNSDLDLSFRKKAGKMISSSFYSDSITLCLSENKEEWEVGMLIAGGLKNELAIPSFHIGSVHVEKPLHREGPGFYSGSLLFLQSISNSPEDAVKPPSMLRTAEFFVVRKNKVFGDDTLRIWNVQLGEIR